MIAASSLPGPVLAGSPSGVDESIHELPTYVSAGEPNAAIIVLIADMYGYSQPSIRLLADRIGSDTGATVYVPDFFAGDAMPVSNLDALSESGEISFMEKSKRNLRRAHIMAPWVFRHREGVSWPIVSGFFEALYKENPTRAVVAGGYSWGGRYAVLLTHRDRWMMSNGTFKEGGLVLGAFAAHPSLLGVPKEIVAISRPVSLALSDCDELVSAKEIEKIRAVMKKKEGIETEVVVYEGAQDGFAVRADQSRPMERQYFEQSLQQSVGWFKKLLDINST